MTQNATFNYINLGAFKVKESNSMPVPLNPDQQRIIEHREGPALVIAGAGSGKTRVVAQRVAHLQEQKDASHKAEAGRVCRRLCCLEVGCANELERLQ